MVINIITVTYNDLNGLMRTYKSICDLGFENSDKLHIKWIVIDGGSTDDTAIWLKSLNCKYPIDWVSESDYGIYNAMNKAIMYIQSDRGYSIFMNAGDEFFGDGFLSSFVTKKFDTVIVYGDAILVPPNGEKYLVKARQPEKAWLGMPTSHQAMFFRNNFLKETLYDESFRLGGDYDLYCKAIKKSIEEDNIAKLIDGPICNFYLDGISVSKRLTALKENFTTRYRVLNLGFLICALLYSAHYIHYYLKLLFPSLMRTLRRSN